MRDVLPTGVRRRLRLRDGLLPAVLLGELLAGMALGAAWPRLTAAPPALAQTSVSAVTVRVAEPVPVVVTPPSPTPVPVPVHAPRNPFATTGG
jgi:hypothetical protein